MRDVTTTLYKFSELKSDKAKAKARDWYRQFVFSDSSDWENVYEDADAMAKLIGIELDQRPYKTVGGGTRTEPAIYFSGFSSQGDGACFEGMYRYKKGAVKAVKDETDDAELIRIAQGLQDVQRRYFYKLRAECRHRGHYSHSGCMDVEVGHADDLSRDLSGAEADIRQLMRDFADWIYKQLEAEHDYLMSDEQVDDSLTANGYEFIEDGEHTS